MEEQIFKANDLELKLNNFEGPLDLLLHLVKEAKIEIKEGNQRLHKHTSRTHLGQQIMSIFSQFSLTKILLKRLFFLITDDKTELSMGKHLKHSK